MKRICIIFLMLLVVVVPLKADTLQLENGVYIIVEGDCLWNIAKKFYENPYLWPKIWEANPYIKNPDLIFPEDQLVIPEMGDVSAAVETEMNETIVEEEVPVILEGEVLVEEEPVEEEVVVVEEETEYIEDEFPDVMPEEENVKDLEIPVSYDNQVLSAGGVVQDGELPEQGYVVTFDETYQQYHGSNETVFLNFYQDVAIGDTFMIYAYEDEVKDPSTKGLLGRKFAIKGIVTIIEMRETSIKGIVKKSFDKIKKGDLLMSYDPEAWIYMDLGGIPEYEEGVIASSKELGEMLGHRQDIVYINLGSEYGVQPGQYFNVFADPKRVKDPMGGTASTGEQALGLIKIIKVFDYSASAVVVQVTDLMEVGDTIRFTER